MAWNWRFAALGLLACCVLSGCGGEPTGTLTGLLFKKGKPLPNAIIELHPQAGEGRSFRGETGDEGRYYMETLAKRGMPVGLYDVFISYHTLLDGKPIPSGEEGLQLIGSEAAKTHRVQLELDLKEGDQIINFDVADGKPAPLEE